MSLNQTLSTLDNLLKLVNNANGRDKATKVLQYGTRIVDDAITSSSSSPSSLELVKRVRLFGTGLATARKVMRFWKPLVGYMALIRFIQRIVRLTGRGSGTASSLSLTGSGTKEKPVQWIEILQLIEKVFVSNYFLFDHLNWASKIGLLSNEKLSNSGEIIDYSGDDGSMRSTVVGKLKAVFNNGKALRYGQIGFTFWMYGVLAGLIATSLELKNNIVRESNLLMEINANLKQMSASDSSEEANRRAKELELELVRLTRERSALLRKALVGLCDLGTAASLSGHWQAKNWIVGVLGVVSAGIGCYEMWPKE